MKIQILSHASEKLPAKLGAWHNLAIQFEKAGHKVNFLMKKDWSTYYFHYLKFRPDVVIVTGIIGALPVYLKKLGLIKVPIIYGWNDYFTEVMGKKWGPNRVAFLEYSTVRYADAIVTPSKFLNKLAEIFGKRTHYIPHGVNDDFLKGEAVNLKGDFKIVYLGDQTGYKQVDKVINAVKGLNCDLYLIEKPNKDLMKNAPKNVHFTGWVDHSKISAYLKVADLLVITSDQDSTLKMFEYIKVGKPILAYKGRIGYVLTHMENAYLTEDFREGIKELMNNKQLMENLQENIKKFKVYTWGEVAKMHLEIIKNLVKSK